MAAVSRKAEIAAIVLSQLHEVGHHVVANEISILLIFMIDLRRIIINFAEKKLTMNQTNTYTLTIPSSQGRLFRSLAKEMGWVFQKTRQKKTACGMEKAMEDVRKGRITTYANVDDFFKKMNI